MLIIQRNLDQSDLASFVISIWENHISMKIHSCLLKPDWQKVYIINAKTSEEYSPKNKHLSEIEADKFTFPPKHNR